MLVLSLFPGIGLLDMAFELEGFCVVRGPDLLWGGDIRRFHPPVGRFDGVIGGPPCQAFSKLARLVRAQGRETAPNMTPEFVRVVAEATPGWWLMENVPDAPEPAAPGYAVRSRTINNRWLGEDQNRVRRFSFGTRDGLALDMSSEEAIMRGAFESPVFVQTVTAHGAARHVPVAIGGSGKVKSTKKVRAADCHTRTAFAAACRLQGLPSEFLSDAPFTVEGKIKVVGNGVPLPMGRAVARAVRRALDLPILGERGAAHAADEGTET